MTMIWANSVSSRVCLDMELLTGTQFNLRPKFREMFISALLNATRSTNAWIVTGGTDTGIMKLVGDALAQQKQSSVPAVAICPWGVVQGRDELSMGSEAQSELRQTIPDCMIRVDNLPAEYSTEERLISLYQRYGVVIGVTLSKEGGVLAEAVHKFKIKGHLAPAKGHSVQENYALISFRCVEDAGFACAGIQVQPKTGGHAVMLRARRFDKDAALSTHDKR